jgi:lysophospholipase L1-like esterase
MIVKHNPPADPARPVRYTTPFFEGTLVSAEYRIEIRLNSEGFRDAEHERTKPEGTLRILAVGDSFTFGVGVEAAETYPKILERLLDERRAEVLNMGIGGLGTIEQADVVRHGVRYAPDLILLGLLAEDRWSPHSGNDLCDNIRASRAAAAGTDAPAEPGLIGFTGRLHRWLALHSDAYFLLMTGAGTSVRTGAIGLREGRNRKELEEGWRLTRDALRDIADVARGAGARLVIVRIPFLYDVHADKPDRTAAVLAEFEKQNGIPVCDLLDVFRKNREQDLYFPADGHWTPAAHELAAEEIRRYLAERGLLGPGRRP